LADSQGRSKYPWTAQPSEFDITINLTEDCLVLIRNLLENRRKKNNSMAGKGNGKQRQVSGSIRQQFTISKIDANRGDVSENLKIAFLGPILGKK